MKEQIFMLPTVQREVNERGAEFNEKNVTKNVLKDIIKEYLYQQDIIKARVLNSMVYRMTITELVETIKDIEKHDSRFVIDRLYFEGVLF